MRNRGGGAKNEEIGGKRGESAHRLITGKRSMKTCPHLTNTPKNFIRGSSHMGPCSGKQGITSGEKRVVLASQRRRK